MISSAHRGWVGRVLLDLNTQCDFLLPRGALPVTNRAQILPRIRQLMNWARLERVPVISSLEAHRPGESVGGLPPHCIDRSRGQRKLPFTLMPRRILVQGDNTLDVPWEPFRRYQQVIFTKREADFLSNPKTDRLINALTPDYWIAFGVTASRCVKSIVLGIMARQHDVVVVRDACGDWSASDSEHAFLQMDAKGAILVTTEELIAGVADHRIAARRRLLAADGNGKVGEPTNGKSTEPGLHDGSREANQAKSNGPAQRKSGPNGKRPAELADFIPPRLLRRKSRASRPSSRSRKDLA